MSREIVLYVTQPGAAIANVARGRTVLLQIILAIPATNSE